MGWSSPAVAKNSGRSPLVRGRISLEPNGQVSIRSVYPYCCGEILATTDGWRIVGVVYPRVYGEPPHSPKYRVANRDHPRTCGTFCVV